METAETPKKSDKTNRSVKSIESDKAVEANEIPYKKGFYIRKTPVVLCNPRHAASFLKEGKTLVLIIRHGQTDWNTELRLQGRECVPLNEVGISQSHNCGKLLKDAAELGLEISAIYSSPLSRAIDTATYLSEGSYKLPVIVYDMLIERDYGMLSGLTIEERREKFPKGEKQVENIEKIADAAVRLQKALIKISSESDGRPVIAVTHGGILNAMFQKITRGKIGPGKNISQNCGISLIAVGKDITIPLAYNLYGESFITYIGQLCRRLNKRNFKKK